MHGSLADDPAALCHRLLAGIVHDGREVAVRIALGWLLIDGGTQNVPTGNAA